MTFTHFLSIPLLFIFFQSLSPPSPSHSFFLFHWFFIPVFTNFLWNYFCISTVLCLCKYIGEREMKFHLLFVDNQDESWRRWQTAAGRCLAARHHGSQRVSTCDIVFMWQTADPRFWPSWMDPRWDSLFEEGKHSNYTVTSFKCQSLTKHNFQQGFSSV